MNEVKIFDLEQVPYFEYAVKFENLQREFKGIQKEKIEEIKKLQEEIDPKSGLKKGYFDFYVIKTNKGMSLRARNCSGVFYFENV